MNAVIAVCTFCELHGPSVLFCTQAFREDNEEFHIPICKKLHSTCDSEKPWYGPSSLMNQTKNCSTDYVIPPLRSDGCEGCTSMNARIRGIISNDHEARVSYISSQYPLHPDLFSIVRQACVRSLSCEVCPGREGPIFFGDDHRGHVLSHTFFLKDTQARGLQSWYSIIIVMMDRIFLLNSWHFLVRSLQSIIKELQAQALKVFNAEQSEHNQRAARLKSESGMTINTFRRLRGNVKARSIMGLTGNQKIFIHLHLWFVWVLKAGAERIVEKIVENFPYDKVIDFDQEEETEEGFIKIHVKECSDECGPTLSSFLSGEINHVSTVTQLSEEMESQNLHIVFSSLKELYKVLGYEKFHCLAYHTIVGNQIIIKSQFLSLMKSIVTCFKELIPKGCFNPIYYSAAYQDSWKCNFLGLLPDVQIPDHVHSSELHIQINVIRRDESKDINSLNDLHFVFHSVAQIPEKVPQALTRMEKAIMDDRILPGALAKFLSAQKDIWLNKAKVLFLFSRKKERTVDENAKLFQALDARDFDKPLLKFWMKGLSTKYKTQILSSSSDR